MARLPLLTPLMLLLLAVLACQAAPPGDVGEAAAPPGDVGEAAAPPGDVGEAEIDPPTVPTTPTDPTAIPPAPSVPTTQGSVIDVQEQVYIVTGVFGVILLCLLVVTMGAAYLALTTRQQLKTLSLAGPARAATVRKAAPAAASAAASAATSAAAAAPAQRPAGRGWQPQPARDLREPREEPRETRDGRDNRAYVDEEPGDQLQQRGFQEYPYDQEPPRRDEGRGRPTSPAASAPYDRFHQPMPDSYLPSDDERHLPEDRPPARYGAGNLARLPKGPAPQPAAFEPRGYRDEGRPRTGQW